MGEPADHHDGDGRRQEPRSQLDVGGQDQGEGAKCGHGEGDLLDRRAGLGRVHQAVVDSEDDPAGNAEDAHADDRSLEADQARAQGHGHGAGGDAQGRVDDGEGD